MEEDDTKALLCRNSDFACSNIEIITNDNIVSSGEGTERCQT
jgi:hypothetical protein